jgi:uncharacterized protein (DUF2235 family)
MRKFSDTLKATVRFQHPLHPEQSQPMEATPQFKKRLIVCCDGTWQRLESPYPSNVVKIAQGITPIDTQGIPQIVFYDEGIGTENKLQKLLGGIAGKGIDRNIQDGYRFLCLNYVPGDEIYLFGFSRGAYTVRSLAGMISRLGLVTRDKIRLAPRAYEIYRQRSSDRTSLAQSHHPAVVEKFRAENSQVAPITLLGCWDTVGALGVPNLTYGLPLDQLFNQDKYRFHDTKLGAQIENAAHAIAIDEHRTTFDVTLMERQPGDQRPLHQVWFPGDHGCVGGGTKATAPLSNAALLWMIEQAKTLGLTFDLLRIEDGVKVNPILNLDFKLNGVWSFLKPHYRALPKSPKAELHPSVGIRWRSPNVTYTPPNLQDFRTELDTTPPPTVE